VQATRWDQACEELAEPAHVVRFGAPVHVKGILGGTEEAGQHVGYLTKYLTTGPAWKAALTAPSEACIPDQGGSQVSAVDRG
jgi:hypothetical protein